MLVEKKSVGRGQHTSGAHIPNNTICTLTDDILNVVLLADVERNLARTRRVRGIGSRHGELGDLLLPALGDRLGLRREKGEKETRVKKEKKRKKKGAADR